MRCNASVVCAAGSGSGPVNTPWSPLVWIQRKRHGQKTHPIYVKLSVSPCRFRQTVIIKIILHDDIRVVDSKVKKLTVASRNWRIVENKSFTWLRTFSCKKSFEHTRVTGDCVNIPPFLSWDWEEALSSPFDLGKIGGRLSGHQGHPLSCSGSQLKSSMNTRLLRVDRMPASDGWNESFQPWRYESDAIRARDLKIFVSFKSTCVDRYYLEPVGMSLHRQRFSSIPGWGLFQCASSATND